MRNALLLCVVLASSACLRTTQYRCSGDSSCGAGGVCESSGFCSFIDGECDSGRRYNDSAGSLAGACTTGTTPQDDADTTLPDGTNIDGMAGDDATLSVCPSGYVTITGGEAGHMYKVITAPNDFDAQEAECQLTTAKAHLFAPADINELTAVDTLVGGITTYWTGINDKTTQGTYVNTFGMAQTYLPWTTGAPSGMAMDACTFAITALHQLDEDRCNTNLAAVCECAP